MSGVRTRWWLLSGLIAALPMSARGDEGLWTFEQATRTEIAQRLGMVGGQTSHQRVRGNVVRFASGPSGALVSPQGLVVTVRRAAVPCLQAWSRSGTDYLQDGFSTGDGQDLGCPGLSLERVVDSEDVTARLRAGLAPGAEIPRDRIASFEQECRARGGLECRVSALFGGAVMRLERHRRHDDVRLVFAPEFRAAAFGTPTARMGFPRYALDVAFFRIYEGGRPLQSGPAIPWNAAGPAARDRVTIAGFPGETERHLPWAFLELLGSPVYRLQAQSARAQAQTLLASSRKQPESPIEEDARARLEHLGALFGGSLALLQNEPIRRRLRAEEARWRGLIEKVDPEGARTAQAAVTAARAAYAGFYQRHILIEGDRLPPFGRLFDLGRKLVRWTQERSRPEGERLSEYRGANLGALERELSSSVPLAPVGERLLIESGLVQLGARLGGKDPLVAALGEEGPAARAERILTGTRLMEPAARKKILESGTLGDAAEDPLLVFVRAVETEARPLRARYDREVEGNLMVYAGHVGRQRSAATNGVPEYSDAGRDFRFSSGTVVGYQDSGRIVPSQTTFAGMVARAAWARPGSPWALPPRWRDRKRRVALTTPINFLTDADVGSGAPGAVVLDRLGQAVGVIIDVTRKSAVNRLLYRDRNDRAIAVHAAGIVEALRQVYDAGKLADELAGGGA